MRTDVLLTGVGRLVTMDDELGVIEDAELLIRDGRVAWLGPAGERPTAGEGGLPLERLDCGGRVALPGLVDCHTHAVFAGDRAWEFAERSAGVSYEEIAARGGGILATMRATRAASEDDLVAAARPRLEAMLDRGVTCVEIKSGYGLDLATELKMLRAARRLGDELPTTVVTTFLGAHSVPPEHRGDRARYLDLVCEEMIPAVAAEGLASFCDVFCEEGVFGVDEARRVLQAGLDHGLVPKVHAEQLHRVGGTALGVDLGAASVDHLERVDAEDVARLAASGQTVAVLLPGATLYLGMDDWAPARAMLDAGVPVALATDCNPGSCMCDDLPLMTTLACTRLRMSPHEALTAITREAARALRLGHERGTLAVGRVGDVAVYDADHEVQLPYRFGRVPAWAVIAGGAIARGPGRAD